MARSTIAIALLGLLACAAVAQADNAETQKKHHRHEENYGDMHRTLTVKVQQVDFQVSGNSIGDTAVVTFDLLDEENEVIGRGRLTGVATEFILSTGTPTDIIFNADLSIQVTEGKFKGAILTAQGPLEWNIAAKDFVTPLNTMVITGVTGKLAGGEGTVVLSNAATGASVTFKYTVDGSKHGKDY